MITDVALERSGFDPAAEVVVSKHCRCTDHVWLCALGADGVEPHYWSDFVAAPAPATCSAGTSTAGGQWEWEDDQPSSGNWKCYDAKCTKALVQAEAAGQTALKLVIKSEEYSVDLAARKQTKKSTGFVRAIRKQPVAQPLAASRPMTARGGFELCSIPESSPCFTEVRKVLATTVDLRAYEVAGISLVRDRAKFRLFAAKKDAMVASLGASGVNERWLWHGTSADLLYSILANGFLRDYNTTAAYGKGTYFAREARYSLQSRYAKPDEKGIQHLLLARVLVGEPCVGRSGSECNSYSRLLLLCLLR